MTTTKTASGEKAIMGGLTVNDVCSKCNNVALSELDNYLCELNEHFFSLIIHSGDQRCFVYDFDKFLRAILKIIYNVARARNWAIADFHDALEYILGRVPSPPPVFHIFLQLIVPTPAARTALPLSPSATEVPPLPMQVYSVDVNKYPGLRAIYWISFWSYRFFVVYEQMHTAQIVRKLSLLAWRKDTRGAKELGRNGRVVVYASSVTVLDATKNDPVFHTQLARVRQFKSDRSSKRRK